MKKNSQPNLERTVEKYIKNNFQSAIIDKSIFLCTVFSKLSRDGQFFTENAIISFI